MKVNDIAENYNIPFYEFNDFLLENKKDKITNSLFGGMIVADEDVPNMVSEFNAFVEFNLPNNKKSMEDIIDEQKRNKELEKSNQEEKDSAFSNMLITSGFSFDGYSVVKYSGYISGDDVVQIDRGEQGFFTNATDVGTALMSSLTEIRREALLRLKNQAFALGCNAIIGVDFDYLTLEPETAGTSGNTIYMPYVFGVTANGNAVIIEKNE
ncbi:YbjQ family protein [Companilactobacillus mishanensis]|uniref:Heavy metal-binding domain-containing protein n=1 Tax=Companilactobacillus mishanensis TaxID=2486008 RepID=A0A5P0ZI06_9LACO|nr:heavy metal-binding domain-containing protein [Companilactobacillus mishanensis]MQS52679.1 heavy metal-binding domain-containing protein [Companilactobacillus mishanensis]